MQKSVPKSHPLRASMPAHNNILVSDNKSVPRKRIHPRWFIDPSDATPDHDSHGEHTFFEQYLVSGGKVLLSAELLHTETFRPNLPLDEAEQFTVRFQCLAQDLCSEYPPLPATTATTIAFPTPPKLTKYAEDLRRKAHGRAMPRLPAVAELGDVEVWKMIRTLTQSQVAPPSLAPAQLQIPTLHPLHKKRLLSNLQLTADATTLDSLSVHFSDLVFIDGYDTQSETQYIDEIEAEWMRNRVEFPGPGHRSQSTSQFIDLCEVDIQDCQYIEDHSEKRVVPMIDLCGSSDDKDNKEEDKEHDGSVLGEKESIESTSQLLWHSEFDIQATRLSYIILSNTAAVARGNCRGVIVKVIVRRDPDLRGIGERCFLKVLKLVRSLHISSEAPRSMTHSIWAEVVSAVVLLASQR
ncbi:hypothetical protein BDD12DRAFT_883255 [Trichophaea hybrida]|nr:hypothetical protein BDD12DRAFT_903073 [Trichophaea hybrida]KAF8539113.1 hypothetical protein BDD12DRAFT_883255 [Trichophaea hybrida]